MEYIDGKKNTGFNEMGIHQKVNIQELEQFRNKVFDKSHIYKDKTKTFHDKYLPL